MRSPTIGFQCIHSIYSRTKAGASFYHYYTSSRVKPPCPPTYPAILPPLPSAVDRLMQRRGVEDTSRANGAMRLSSRDDLEMICGRIGSMLMRGVWWLQVPAWLGKASRNMRLSLAEA